MSSFAPSNVDEITYDFTKIPAVGGGLCSGKGVVPEPTDDQIDSLIAVSGDIADKDPFSRVRELWTKALVKLGVPVEHLDELPLDQFHTFRNWLAGELLPSVDRSASLS